jgi:sigma-E factor negative regulatory protein RseC
MPAKDETIIHPGVIDKVEGGKIFVKILSQSACSTCHAKGMCSLSEVEEKIIEVDHNHPHNYKSGDQVMVGLEQSLGKKAVLLGYFLPFVIFTVSIIVLISLIHHEGLAALISFLLLAPYYLTLYFMRDRLRREFRFRII